MPNSDQIIHHCGNWANAMRLAGLTPPTESRERRKGCPVPDAIAYYDSQRGCLPTRKQLDRFAADVGFSLALVRGKGWHEWIALGRERIADFPQLPAPPPYGSPEPDQWEPIDIDVVLPPRGTRRYSLRAILEAFEDYLGSLDALGAPTHRDYRQWCTGDPTKPSLVAVLARGTFDQLTRIVSDPDWRDHYPNDGDDESR